MKQTRSIIKLQTLFEFKWTTHLNKDYECKKQSLIEFIIH